MKWLLSLTTRTKLFISFGLIVASLLVVIVTAYRDIIAIQESQETLFEKDFVITDSIAEAMQAATQIAASSQEQLVGMDQVALAMENIKQASAQNVASTRQAEAAAQNLHELGQKLKQLVQQYKV